MKKRLTALALGLVMLLTLLPTAVFAEEEKRTLTNQEMFALLPAAPLAAYKPKTLREAECLLYPGVPKTVEEERQNWEQWGVPATGLEKEVVFRQIVSLTESLISGKSSDTEKAKAIYQWVTDNIKYDYPVWKDSDWGGYQEYSSPNVFDAFYTFALRTGVCEGYSRLSLLMLQIAELPGAYLRSNDHDWNAVYAGGRWILFDATHGQWDFGADDRLSHKETIVHIEYRNGNDVLLRDFHNDGTVTCRLIVERELCPDTLVIPDGVTNLGSWFNESMYDSLTNVIFPTSLKEIDSSAFQSCQNLTSVVIPDGVTKIGYEAFEYCDKLTSVTIPSSVTSIKWRAFSGCRSLTDVYYGGTEEQWRAIDIASYNSELQSATIHYNSPMPSETPAPAVDVAYPSTQSVLVDGAPVEFQCYALKDAAGNDTNYIKLRDVASVLSGTAVQFNVGWDGAVNIETGKAYAPNGSEMSTPFSGERAYEPATAETRIDGSPAALDAIVLKDDAGGAYTYYKLRDLGTALGFTVDWSAEKGIFIETK